MDALHGRLLKGWRKGLTATTQECCEQYWMGPGGSTPQSSSCTATYHPSRKLSKLDEPDMQNTAGEVGMSSLVMYSYGPLHMVEQKQGNQLEPTYSSSVRIRGVTLRTYRKQWMIGRGGERGSGISVLMAQHDDDDIYIYKDLDQKLPTQDQDSTCLHWRKFFLENPFLSFPGHPHICYINKPRSINIYCT